MAENSAIVLYTGQTVSGGSRTFWVLAMDPEIGKQLTFNREQPYTGFGNRDLSVS